MKHKRQGRSSGSGALRARLVQMRVVPGQPQINAEAMLAAIAAARSDRVELLVFPDLALSGGRLGGAWEREAFLRECEACGERIREAAAGPVVVFGNVAVDWARRGPDGRVRTCHALFVAHQRRFVGPAGGSHSFVVQSCRPGSRPFDDGPWSAAESGRAPRGGIVPVAVGRLLLGCLPCGDPGEADAIGASRRPAGGRAPDLLIGPACVPYVFHAAGRRFRQLSAWATARKTPLLYVNPVGLQNNGKAVFPFDGASCAVDGAGGRLSLPSFEEGSLTRDIPLSGAAAFGPAPEAPVETIGDLGRALLYGLREFSRQCRLGRAVVGVSGGIDSAVVAALCSRVWDRDRLLLVNLPGPFTSPTTVALARRLAANLGCFYAEVPIAPSVDATREQLDALEIASPDGRLKERLRLTEGTLENVQARDRSARVLAALAAAFGGGFTCNANKAEAAVGYATLYGDVAGFLAPIADLWKGEVYRLGRHLNAQVFRRQIIPEGCFNLPPSAELSPAQNVDAGRGDPLIYPYHDRLFASWIEAPCPASPEDILEWYRAGQLEQQLGYEGRVADLFPDAHAFVADLERWWTRYQGLGAVKRVQSPPILAVKPGPGGFERREALLMPWFSRRYRELKARIAPRA